MIKEIKDTLTDGDIVLFHNKGIVPFSWGIRLLTKSFWNHCGLIVRGIDNKLYVIEALGMGVVKTQFEKYEDEKSQLIKIVSVKQEAFKGYIEYKTAIDTAVRRAWETIGCKYDWGAIVWLGIKYVSRGIWNKTLDYTPLHNPLQNRYRVFCSELVCRCFSGTSNIIKNLFAGKNYPDVTCSVITPKDIGKSENIKLKYGMNIL